MTHQLVKDIMRDNVVTIAHTATFREALTKCIASKVNGLVLVDADGRYVDFLDTATLLRASLPDYMEDDATAARFADDDFIKEELAKIADKPVADVLNIHMKTAKPTDTLTYAIAIASSNGQGRLPVIDEDGKPVGLLTRTELKLALGSAMGVVNAL